MVVHSPAAPTATPGRSDESAYGPRASRARRDLAPGDPLLRAAVLLLAAPGTRFNIDLLTRRTGFSRQFVAACARRLFDNGVWRDGRARYAADGPEDPRFWNDAEVALGTLCRRSGPEGHEWAAPGTWNKPYDFVGAPCGEGLAIAYQDPWLPEPPDEAWAPEPEAFLAPADVEVAAVAPVSPAPVLTRMPPPPRFAAVAATGGAGVAWLDPELRLAGAEGRGELFPGAAWLG